MSLSLTGGSAWLLWHRPALARSALWASWQQHSAACRSSRRKRSTWRLCWRSHAWQQSSRRQLLSATVAPLKGAAAAAATAALEIFNLWKVLV
ncbi:hypothetical protein COO60DRAFT_1501036 [Scenedesmus sp. NREL 46B-D3]|nr:hypothetical protein COO60DRAFT_1501036 [Scenedesmus sp. NREL 46B-D3]